MPRKNYITILLWFLFSDAPRTLPERSTNMWGGMTWTTIRHIHILYLMTYYIAYDVYLISCTYTCVCLFVCVCARARACVYYSGKPTALTSLFIALFVNAPDVCVAATLSSCRVYICVCVCVCVHLCLCMCLWLGWQSLPFTQVAHQVTSTDCHPTVNGKWNVFSLCSL